MSTLPPSSPTTLAEMQRAADQVVLGRFAPAGVLVSEAMEIVQFRGRTSPYLEPAQGEATLNLLSMVPFGAAQALREALGEAQRSNLPVRRERVALVREHDSREIGFEVLPIRLPAEAAGFLVLFTEPGPPAAIAAPAVAPVLAAPADEEGHAAAHGRQEPALLRRELAAANDHVRALVAVNLAQAEQLREARAGAAAQLTAKVQVEAANLELAAANQVLRAANTGLAAASTSLNASGELASAIVETLTCPLLVLSAGLRVESANQAFLAAFGVDRAQTIGRRIYDLGNGQWDIPALRRLLEDVLPSDSAFDDFEVTHDFAGIGPMTMLLNARRLRGGDDPERRIVLAFADTTERSRISLALEDTAIEQLRSNGELAQFAAVAAHDLQEPLRMMSSYIGLLQVRYAPLFDERARGYMAFVTGGAKRMASMIKGILDYSRVGHEAIGVTGVDSAAALGDALANLASQIEEAGATVTFEALPWVRANSDQLTQLFQNLIGNALKFCSPERPPAIRIVVSESAHEWGFAIADNGIGMAQPDFARIFAPFTRTHAKRRAEGSGIGLATCQKIVLRHHGRIWVEATLDVGSTFHFTLPK